MADRKAVVKNADMSEDMQQDAVDCASQALEKYNIEKVCFIFTYFSQLNLSFPPYSICYFNFFIRISLHTLRKSLTRSIRILL